MCLMALALGQTRRWPLVMASNRDEFQDRPTRPLSRWSAADGTVVISGRDLQAGGTWLGCSPGGRVALVTNVRDGLALAGLRSRGELPLHWLGATHDSATFLADTPANDYAGCNLILGDSLTGEWTWASNRAALADEHSTPEPARRWLNGWQFKVLSPGFYGLSNAQLDTPWPKTLALKSALAKALKEAPQGPLAQPESEELRQAARAHWQSRVWAALACRQRAASSDLPSTGIDADLEHGLSSAWIDLPERRYGTRCSSLVWLEHTTQSGLHLHIAENTWTANGLQPSVSSSAALDWPLPGAASCQ